MVNRWALFSLAPAALMACTDSTAPPGGSGDTPALTVPEYAAQLRGDPFLKSVSVMLGHPHLVDVVDQSLGAIDRSGTTDAAAARMLIGSTRPSLDVAVTDSAAAPTESDVLSAVFTITLDRIAQVNGSSNETSPTTDPPPSR
jgi:hypothetical protein